MSFIRILNNQIDITKTNQRKVLNKLEILRILSILNSWFTKSLKVLDLSDLLLLVITKRAITRGKNTITTAWQTSRNSFQHQATATQTMTFTALSRSLTKSRSLRSSCRKLLNIWKCRSMKAMIVHSSSAKRGPSQYETRETETCSPSI